MKLPVAFPSKDPTVPVVTGAVKSNKLKSVQVPVVKLDALVLYWKSNLSVLPSVPNLHCSPVYSIVKLVITPPVLFMKFAPMVGFKLPDCSPPKERSVETPVPKLYVSPLALDPVPAE